jgi:hypothetical protein
MWTSVSSSSLENGQLVDPGDDQHKLYASEGALIGRLDLDGHVWNSSGSHLGSVDMSLACGIGCKRSQARRILLGVPPGR